MSAQPSLAAYRDEVKDTWPFLAVVTLIIVVGSASAIRSVDALHEAPRLILFSALLVMIVGLFWLGPYLMTSPNRLVALLAVQGAAVFTVGLMTPEHWLVLAIFPALAGMAIGVYWPDLRKCLVAGVFVFALLVVNLAVGKGLHESVRFLPFVGFALAFVFVYVVLFVRQVETRKTAQGLLRELEVAHEHLRQYAARVEELTLSQERERMGRELHDTLAQGVAGLIMQLEAVDCHLEGGDTERASEVLRLAMSRARSTHHEARRAIQALRASVLEEVDLIEALRREVDQFTTTSGTPCRYRASTTDLDLSPEKAQHVLRIVQEGLSNVLRHAHASEVVVEIDEEDGVIRLTLGDDGVGFDTSEPGDGFGLAGMRERAARIGGELQVTSSPGSGTVLDLRVARDEP